MFTRLKRLFSKNTPAPFEKRRVLIVDDNEIDRRIAVKVLQTLGFETMTAENGQEGLKAAAAHKPDLILLDCDMPVMNGMEMCKLLKKQPAIGHIPVIFLTGSSTPRYVIECFDADAESYLSKPLNAKILSSQIQSIFEENSAR